MAPFDANLHLQRLSHHGKQRRPSFTRSLRDQCSEEVANFSIVGSRRRWSGSIGGRYVSALYSTNTNTDIVHGVPGSYDPYFIAEATAGYEFRRGMTVFASLNNALNRTYYQFYQSPGRQEYVGLRIRIGGDH